MEVQGWVTGITLAFGIAAGIAGVAAYLSMYRRQKKGYENSTGSPSSDKQSEQKDSTGTDSNERE